jgi:hypothetical protein
MAGKRVVVTLNPDSSLDDIKNAFTEIARRQKQFQPDFRPTHLTRDAFDKFYEVLQMDYTKFIEGDKNNQSQLNVYEKALFRDEKKKHGIHAAIKKINKPAYDGPARNPRFNFRFYANDEYLAKKIATEKHEENLKRILNVIRQKRKRQKA